jgi:hypothetical protein
MAGRRCLCEYPPRATTPFHAIERHDETALGARNVAREGETMRLIGRLTVLAGAAVLLMAPAASAQVIGTYRWQLAPYCNVVTLTVVQQGASFVLNGFDDQCGAAQLAGVSGTAQLNPDGTAGLEFTVIRPDGLTMPVAAVVNLTTLSGSWVDEWSSRNTFVFNPAAASGEARPILLRGVAQIQFRAQNALDAGNALIAFGHNLRAIPTLTIVTGAVPAQCGGSVLDPRPLPGNLCFYVFDDINVGTFSGQANRSVAEIEVVTAANTVRVTWQARWILNVP